MRIVVVGTGYVGLVSGACFADFGHDVTCVDIDEAKVSALRSGEMPIFEPGLDRLVVENVNAGRLGFQTDLDSAVAAAEVVFIAVGTPSRRGDGHADLSYVYAAAASIARAVKGPTVVVTKSTVPVGTGDEVERIIRETRPDAQVTVVSNPEFLREGAAIDDFKHPDRIVIGIEDDHARAVMTEIYGGLERQGVPLLFVDRRTAELIKYAANAFLAMKISFINEVADLCEQVGANVDSVAQGIGLDARIGPKFLKAGPGYGGSCFPKDTLALVKTGRDYGSPLSLVEATVDVNERRKQALSGKIMAACGGSVRGKTIALLGLTFKANTDDMRDAPSIAIAAGLFKEGAEVRAYDPQGMAAARSLLGPVTYADDAYSAVAGADCVVIVTEWDEFLALDFERLKRAMARPLLVDLRNLYEGSEVVRHGFHYVGIGRRNTARAGVQPDQLTPTPAGERQNA